jgi:hypothetical protein
MVTPPEAGRRMLTGNAAAAWGARLAEVDYVPAFPITPQTEIIEDLAGGSPKGRWTASSSPSTLFTAFATCPPGWGYDPSQGHHVAKLALETGVWPLKEAIQGQVRHTYIPDRRRPVEEYLRIQRRFQHLFSPRRQDEALRSIQNAIDSYWKEVALRELPRRTPRQATS